MPTSNPLPPKENALFKRILVRNHASQTHFHDFERRLSIIHISAVVFLLVILNFHCLCLQFWMMTFCMQSYILVYLCRIYLSRGRTGKLLNDPCPIELVRAFNMFNHQSEDSLRMRTLRTRTSILMSTSVRMIFVDIIRSGPVQS